jgi:hypothetical protein
MKVRRYLFLLFKIGLIGPQISACTSWRIPDALHMLTFGNEYLRCLPIKQSSQTLEGMLNCCDIPSTIFFCWRTLRPFQLRCPYRQCQSWDWSVIRETKHLCSFDWYLEMKMNILLCDMAVSMIKPLFGWKILQVSCYMRTARPFSCSCPMLSRLFFRSGT